VLSKDFGHNNVQTVPHQNSLKPSLDPNEMTTYWLKSLKKPTPIYEYDYYKANKCMSRQ